jgi:hypothetical protein
MGDHAHRVLHREGMARGVEIEEVERDERFVHAYERRAVGRGLALHDARSAPRPTVLS